MQLCKLFLLILSGCFKRISSNYTGWHSILNEAVSDLCSSRCMILHSTKISAKSLLENTESELKKEGQLKKSSLLCSQLFRRDYLDQD